MPPTAVGHTVMVRPEGTDVLAVYLGPDLLVRHRVRPKGAGRVTLAEHAEAIRKLTRGSAQKAYGRRGGPPRFVQRVAAAEPVVGRLDRLKQVAPVVEIQGLDAYEALLAVGAS
ncbi:MAG: hypothetical protein U5R14_01865 [Gemmatimonadota bacterium]|nr:hypothetical protein [Gemmatimonadota bacterium]